MMHASAAAIKEAIDIYRNKPEIYNNMLANCYPSTKRYNWNKTGASFASVYQHGTNSNVNDFGNLSISRKFS
jgi:glycogen synthase